MANKDWLQVGADGITFGERLDDLINSRGITQSQLAEETGVKQSAISEYINGRKSGTSFRAPDCAAIIALARYFSVSTDYLLGLSSVKTSSADLRDVIDLTGLTEENAGLLVGLQGLNARKVLEFVNDPIPIVTEGEALYHYAMMKSALTVPRPVDWSSININELSDDELGIFSGQERQYGYVHFTGKDAFEYHCSRIAREIEKAITDKHISEAEWREKDGIH